MPHAATDVTSLNQEAMLLAQLVHERSPRFHIVTALELAEAPDHGCLSEAVADLWQRHDAFRTGFLQAFDARPEAIRSVVAARMTDPVGSVGRSLFTPRVHPRAPCEVLRYQLAHLADDAAERALARLTREHGDEPFDVGCPPLVRLVSAAMPRGRHVLVIVVHHLIGDFWGVQLIARLLAAAYRQRAAKVAPVAPAPPFARFAAWEREQIATGAWDRSIEYWTTQWDRFGRDQIRWHELQQTPVAVIHTPAAAAERSRVFDSELWSRALAFARARRVSPYVLLLSSLVLLARQRTGRPRVGILAGFANRASWRHAGRAIGSFTNTHLLGVDVASCRNGGDLLSRVREAVIGALTHEAVPNGFLASIVGRRLGQTPDWLPDLSMAFDVSSPFRPGPDADFILRYRAVPPPPITHALHLRGLVTPSGLRLSAIYPADSLSVASVANLLRAIEAGLRILTDGPECPIAAFPLLLEPSGR